MDQPVSERLKGLGLDVEFLAWLEGEEQVLPELSRIRDIEDADLVAAIRAAGWLGQFFMDEKVISPHTSEEWRARYDLLEKHLQGALQLTSFYHAMSTREDLEALETVLETVLPRSFWEQYSNDIHHLRQQGLPEDFPKTKAKRSGGVKESEQTGRMRAASYYVSRRSKTPYVDLAGFWNERLGVEKYSDESIRDRVRKGHFMSKKEGVVQRSLEFWKRVYRGDLRDVFPGPFLPSPKLKELYRRPLDRGGPG